MPLHLSQDDIDFYNGNGYLVIPDFWDEDTVSNLRNHIFEIISSMDLTESKSVFGPKTDDEIRETDEYFLTSGREIRYFWEAKAFNEKKEMIEPPELSINKIGHGLHDLDPQFEKVSYDPRIGKICRDLGQQRPLAVQSMYIFKQAKIGGEVIPHQDGAFLYTEPQTCIGFWWPLDNCSKENGCLWAVPGSHKLGVHRRFKRSAPPKLSTEFEPLKPVEFDISNAVPLETKKGSMVIIHSSLVHYSAANLSETARHAYSIHVVDGTPGIVYPADNWLQRPVGYPFREIPAS